MGMKAEFNWYIVLKDDNIVEPEDIFALRDRQVSCNNLYHFMKTDYRIYPMDTPLPIIYNGKCLGMGSVASLSWNCNKTNFAVQPILIFKEDDPTAHYYESSFTDYKRKQQKINDGGKVDLRNVANLSTRKRF